MWYVLIIPDMTVIVRKRTGLGANSVEAVLLSTWAIYQRWWVETGLALVGLLPGKTKIYLESKIGSEDRGECAHY